MRASDVSDLKAITSPTTIVAADLNSQTDLTNGTLYADGTLLCIGGCGYNGKDKGSVEWNQVTYQNVYQIKNNRQVAIKISFNAIVTVVGQTNQGREWQIGTTSAGKEIAGGGAEGHVTGYVDGSTVPQVLYINATSDLYLGAIIIEENSKSVLAASPSSVNVKVTNVKANPTATFTLSGSNLAKGETVTLSLASSVAGLSVSPTSVTVGDDGSVNQEVTVSYESTDPVEASTVTLNAVCSTNEVSCEVAVNYSAVFNTLTPISEKTTFELKNTGKNLDVVTSDEYVLLSDAGSEAPFANNIMVKGVGTNNVTWRDDAVQAGYFKFQTTVPGNVTVKFSDVGGSADRSNRYANVNGTRSDKSSNSSNTSVTSASIPVGAGEVIIKGEEEKEGGKYSDNQIRVFEITFTPVTSTTVAIGEKFYRTFTSKWPLTFPVEGLTAYIATIEGDNVKFTEVTGNVPAGEGLLLKATEATTYTINVPGGEIAAIENDFIGVITNTTVEGAGIYILYDGNKGLGFYQTTAEAFTVGANTAYIPANVVPTARTFISLDGETTGVNDVESIEDTDGKFFDLQGRQVSKPTKGLYISNGKKYIVK